MKNQNIWTHLYHLLTADFKISVSCLLIYFIYSNCVWVRGGMGRVKIRKSFRKAGVAQQGLRCWGKIWVGEEVAEGHSSWKGLLTHNLEPMAGLFREQSR